MNYRIPIPQIALFAFLAIALQGRMTTAHPLSTFLNQKIGDFRDVTSEAARGINEIRNQDLKLELQEDLNTIRRFSFQFFDLLEKNPMPGTLKPLLSQLEQTFYWFNQKVFTYLALEAEYRDPVDIAFQYRRMEKIGNQLRQKYSRYLHWSTQVANIEKRAWELESGLIDDPNAALQSTIRLAQDQYFLTHEADDRDFLKAARQVQLLTAEFRARLILLNTVVPKERRSEFIHQHPLLAPLPQTSTQPTRSSLYKKALWTRGVPVAIATFVGTMGFGFDAATIATATVGASLLMTLSRYVTLQNRSPLEQRASELDSFALERVDGLRTFGATAHRRLAEQIWGTPYQKTTPEAAVRANMRLEVGLKRCMELLVAKVAI